MFWLAVVAEIRVHRHARRSVQAIGLAGLAEDRRVAIACCGGGAVEGGTEEFGAMARSAAALQPLRGGREPRGG